MTIQIHMFSAFVDHWIFGDVNGCLAIREYVEEKEYQDQQVSEPSKLFLPQPFAGSDTQLQLMKVIPKTVS